MFSRYRVAYFPEFPLKRLALVKHNEIYKEGVKTGGMSKDDFLALKEDISINGLINPIVIEMDNGNPRRCRVAVGFNRTEAYKQLGHSTIKALIFYKSHIIPDLGLGEYQTIRPLDLESFMAIHHPKDDSWRQSHWADVTVKAVTQFRINQERLNQFRQAQEHVRS